MNPLDSTSALRADSTQVKRARRLRAEDAPIRREEKAGRLIELLQQSPQLATNRSFIIENAVDEFLALSVNCPTLSREEYCRRFALLGSSIQSSIYRQLEVEQFVGRHSWLTARMTPEEWPKPGERRGSFRVIEEIGRGALSRVYLCSQPDLGHRQVVVKISRSAVLEADALGRLRHPNIVPIHAVERDPATQMTMLCMPFLGRSTLHDLLDLAREKAELQTGGLLKKAGRHWEQPSDRVDDRACPPASPPIYSLHDCIAYIGARLADALAHAHANGIVHGDIKPSNILLSRDGAPLLMDFNLSGNLARSTVAMGGTLPYMPPEQLQAIALENPDAGVYDKRSDIFSIGVVLYEALSGRSPFPLTEESTALNRLAEQLVERQREGCVSLTEVDKTTSPSLARAIEQCLAFHPEDRLESAQQLRILLEAEVRPLSRLRSRLRRHRRSAALVAAIGAALCAAIITRLVQLPPQHVRLVQQALEYRDSQDFAAAQENLTKALRLVPNYGDAQLELGRTAIAQGELSRASEIFSRLAELEESARSAAYLAYCYSLKGDATSAIPWYERAQQWGCDAPEVRNNLALSYELGGSIYSELERLNLSDDQLRRALEQRPKSRTIRLNSICLAIRKAQASSASVTEDTLHLCRELAAEAPNCGYALQRAAAVFALASIDSPEISEEGVELLARAIALGHGPSADHLMRSAQWDALRRSARFSELVRLSQARRKNRNNTNIPRLLEPFSLAVDKTPLPR